MLCSNAKRVEIFCTTEICSLRRLRENKKPKECLGYNQKLTPTFPKVEEETGRVSPNILLTLIQILEEVDSAMLSISSQACKVKQEALQKQLVKDVLLLPAGTEIIHGICHA